MSATTKFTIQRIDRRDVQVLEVGGYMGNQECKKLEAQLDQLTEQGCHLIILDLNSLTFVTSANLDRLASQSRRLEHQGGSLRIAGAPSIVASLIQMGRPERNLSLFDDLSAAVRSSVPPAIKRPVTRHPQKSQRRAKQMDHA